MQLLKTATGSILKGLHPLVGLISSRRIAKTTTEGGSLKKIFWRLCFCVVTFIFLTRFVVSPLCGVEDWTRSLLKFGFCLFLLYISFIVEGIVLAVSKIEDYDDKVTIRTFKDYFGIADVLGPSLVRVKRKADGVLMGQPLIAIVVAFLFNGVLDSASIPDAAVCTFVSPHYLFVFRLYSSGFFSIVVTTMLIYWLSQVLPQSIGKRSAAAFMRFPGAMTTANALALATPLGIGEPGLWLERFVKGAGLNTTFPQMPLGDSKFLEAMSTDYDRKVTSRKIKIETLADGIRITDEAQHLYLVDRRDIDHVYSFARGQFDPDKGVTVTLGFPENFCREPTVVTRLYRYTFDYDILDQQLPPDEVGSNRNLLWGESVFVVRSSSDRPIPWTTMTASYYYREKEFDMSTEASTELSFPLGLPTEQIEVTIFSPPGGFIYSAELSFTWDESRIFDKFNPVNRGTPDKKREEGSICLIHMHPPLATEMRLRIDFRRQDASSG